MNITNLALVRFFSSVSALMILKNGFEPEGFITIEAGKRFFACQVG